MSMLAIDPVWETDLYAQGHHLNRHPFDAGDHAEWREVVRKK